jgi:hypothetical protein
VASWLRRGARGSFDDITEESSLQTVEARRVRDRASRLS